jgi:hypothetical protein
MEIRPLGAARYVCEIQTRIVATLLTSLFLAFMRIRSHRSTNFYPLCLIRCSQMSGRKCHSRISTPIDHSMGFHMPFKLSKFRNIVTERNFAIGIPACKLENGQNYVNNYYGVPTKHPKQNTDSAWFSTCLVTGNYPKRTLSLPV